MSKWQGKIGFWLDHPVESAPGVWSSKMNERTYRGDVIENNYRWVDRQNGTNDSIELSHQFSIVADPFAQENYRFMRYVEFRGCKWSVTGIRLQYPRIIISVGGVYNERPH